MPFGAGYKLSIRAWARRRRRTKTGRICISIRVVFPQISAELAVFRHFMFQICDGSFGVKDFHLMFSVAALFTPSRCPMGTSKPQGSFVQLFRLGVP